MSTVVDASSRFPRDIMRQRTAALRDFHPAYVGLGTGSALVEHKISASPPKEVMRKARSLPFAPDSHTENPVTSFAASCGARNVKQRMPDVKEARGVVRASQ